MFNFTVWIYVSKPEAGVFLNDKLDLITVLPKMMRAYRIDGQM